MLESFWYVACESMEIHEKPITRQIFGKPIVLFRDQNNQVSALEDRCAHRNFPLSAGRIVDGAIQCSYHGWCFDRGGRACTIPSVPHHHECGPISVRSYPCMERYGYIWMVPSGETALSDPPAPGCLDAPGFESFRLKNRFQGSVESCLENFLDCPHAAFVHAGLFRSHHARTIRAAVRTLDDGAEAEYFGESREGGVVWKLLSRKQAHLRHVDRFIRPSTSRVDYEFSDGRIYSISSYCTPVDERVTDVYTVITFRFGIFSSIVKPIFKFLSKRIIAQDVDVVRTQSWNISRFGEGPRFRLVQSDLLLPKIIQWRNALAEGRGAPASPANRERDVQLCI